MHIRLEASKGIDFRKLIGKEVSMSGIDVETGKYLKITIDVYDKDGAYLRIEETEAPPKKTSKKKKQQHVEGNE